MAQTHPDGVVADPKHVLKFLECGVGMPGNAGLEFLGVELAPMAPALFRGQRSGLRGIQTPQERCELFDQEAVDMVQRWRDAEAANWKRARRLFRALESEARARVEERYWGNRFMPKTAVYLLEVIRAVTNETQP